MASNAFDQFVNGLNNRLEEPIRQHLKNVYSSLAISTLAAAAGGYVHVFTKILEGNFLTAVIAFGLLMALLGTPDNGKNHSLRLAYLVGFAFLTGLGMGQLLNYAIYLDPSIVASAIMGTAVIFTCFTLSALYSPAQSWLYLGGTLMSCMTMVFLSGLASLLFGSQLLFQVHLYLGLLVMCGFVAYDTQAIIEKRRRGDKDFIRHSVDLFIDLVGIFRRLVILLTQKQEREEQQQQRNRKSN